MNTNYIPLYRKYRPQTIEQIVGQEHIKKALSNAIEMDRISHAYLFTGPRGTGKTSTARIFAKSLNCVNGPTVSPCNECENCNNITNSLPIDVIEIDAASNRTVSDADEIIQKVALAPIHSRYKIYIIDEVHMLSVTAFNALLKTLEEPPKNVIFILATTEVHKVLDTIKSRCQRFDFKRITTSDIANHLRYISDKESINITDDALNYIAQNSAGGMRDSIALLDQLSVLNSKDAAIGVDDINALLGRLSFDSLTSLFTSIVNSNKLSALNELNTIYNKGNEPVQILSNLLEYLRNALILKNIENQSETTIVQLNPEQMNVLRNLIEKIEVHQIVSLINKTSEYIKELKLTTNPKLWLDVAIIDLANLTENTTLEDLQSRLSQLEKGGVQQLVNTSPYNTPPSPVNKVDMIKSIKQNLEKTVEKPIKVQQAEVPRPVETKTQTVSEAPVQQSSNSTASNDLNTIWIKFLDAISSFPSRAVLKQQALPVKLTKDEIIITISKNSTWLKQFSPDGSKYSLLEEAGAKLFGSKVAKLIVRAPEANDDKIRNEQRSIASDDEKPAPASKTESSKTQVIKDVTPNIEPLKTENKPKPAVIKYSNTNNEEDEEEVITPDGELKTLGNIHSDEVNMVLDLFEGKFIE